MRTKGAVFLLVCILASTAYAQWTELHIAAMEGSVTEVRYLLSSGANVNAVYYDDGSARDQMTPLHAAAIGNDTNVIELLVNAGASVNAREAGGWTPFHIAASQGNTRAMEIMLDAGANPNTVRDGNYTPAHDAAFQGHSQAIEILAAAGANLNATDSDGNTPIDYALQSGNLAAADALRQYQHTGLSAQRESNSCRWANDGECEEPNLCAAGTDIVDCSSPSSSGSASSNATDFPDPEACVSYRIAREPWWNDYLDTWDYDIEFTNRCDPVTKFVAEFQSEVDLFVVYYSKHWVYPENSIEIGGSTWTQDYAWRSLSSGETDATTVSWPGGSANSPVPNPILVWCAHWAGELDPCTDNNAYFNSSVNWNAIHY